MLYCEIYSKPWRGILNTNLCNKVCQWHYHEWTAQTLTTLGTQDTGRRQTKQKTENQKDEQH